MLFIVLDCIGWFTGCEWFGLNVVLWVFMCLIYFVCCLLSCLLLVVVTLWMFLFVELYYCVFVKFSTCDFALRVCCGICDLFGYFAIWLNSLLSIVCY